MLTLVEQRLNAIGDGQRRYFDKVGGSLNVALAIKSGVHNQRECYVLPLPSSYKAATEDLGPIQQKGVEGFGVLVGIKTINDPTGAAGSAELDDVKKTLCKHLVGWQPGPEYERVTLSRSEPLGIKQNGIWYLYRFAVPVYLTQQT